MSARAIALWLWAALLLVAAVIVARAHYSADMSAFLPAAPSAEQRLLVQQLRDGPLARLLLLGIEGADADTRARLSNALAQRLRAAPEFTDVSNGAAIEADAAFVFAHRYLLSAQVTPQRFSVAGLHDAIAAALDELATPAGLLLKSLLPRDPTGESAALLAQFEAVSQPRRSGGVWVSADGTRALLLVRTRAAGSDTDAQRQALGAIEAAFAAARGASTARLLLSGPGVFAVHARETIQHQVVRLSLWSTGLIVLLLLAVYRSLPVLLLGLLPVASGALVAVAAVALGFGVVHGLTLGFGTTLMGESVDYSIYLLIQGREGWVRSQWPTVRLGLLTSICGFASLLPSYFPGLAQLGLYSITGLIGAALVTRYVLPGLVPAHAVRDLTPFGVRLAAACAHLRAQRGWLLLLALASLTLLYRHRDTLWDRRLTALSPMSVRDQALDATLRQDLGAADVSDIVIVAGNSMESALEASERASARLQPLLESGVIAGVDAPSRYLPSAATQRARLAALPAPAELAARLPPALAGLPLRPERLAPFVDDVAAARAAKVLTPADLAGTSLDTALNSLLLPSPTGWNALLPLRAPATGLDEARVRAALAPEPDAHVLNLAREAGALYSGYLAAAARLSLYGLGAIALLLAVALRSVRRAARVLVPLLLAVASVAAGLVAMGHALTLLHLIGLLLIVAVGSNYALFFDHTARAEAARVPRTLASLVVANVATVVGFGVLAFSSVPVLQALGSTVAPGALLALLLSAALAEPPRGVPA